MDFSGRFLLNFIYFSEKQGASIESILNGIQLSIEELCAEEKRVSMDVYNLALELAVDSSKDPYLGLHAGEYMNLAASGLIGQITQTCATVKEALDYCCAFASLGCQALPMQLTEEKENYVLKFVPDPVWQHSSQMSVKHTIDGILAFTIKEFHALTRNQYYPIAVDYTFSNDGAEELERVLNCPVRYNQKEIVLYFEKMHINESVVTSNYDLLRVLVKHAEEKVQEMEAGLGFANQVKKAVVNMIKPGFPSIQQVASNLNLSVRSVQRKLNDEGMNYSGLLEELKREFALQYLKDEALTINEVAYLLDYANASAFIRSFKKWYGQSPGTFRSSLKR